MEETDLTKSLGDVLIVNSAYLARQKVRDSSGRRIDAVPDGKVLLVIPEGRMGERESIEETVYSYLHPHWVTTQLLRAWGRDADAHVDADGHSEFDDQAGPDITVAAGLQGQTVFDYQFSGMSAYSDFEHVKGPTVTDPIVIAMDASCGVQNLYYDYSVYANASSILYPDPDRTWGELTALGLDSIVVSLRTPTDALHADVASCERTLCVELLAFALAVTVLAASGIALAQTHVRGRAQEVFVEYVHGWSFPRIHRLLIACEAGLFTVILIAGAHRYQDLARRSALYSYSQSYHAASTSAEIAAAAIVCVMSLAVCLTATALSTRALCRRRAGAM